MNNKALYENIMARLSVEVKNFLNESKLNTDEKIEAWHNGERRENIKACNIDKLLEYKAKCKVKGYDAEVAIINAELIRRGVLNANDVLEEEAKVKTRETVEAAVNREFSDGISEIRYGLNSLIKLAVAVYKETGEQPEIVTINKRTGSWLSGMHHTVNYEVLDSTGKSYGKVELEDYGLDGPGGRPVAGFGPWD